MNDERGTMNPAEGPTARSSKFEVRIQNEELNRVGRKRFFILNSSFEFRTSVPRSSFIVHRSRERGFTLAGVIVIMTIMMIVVAYTVPRQWSTVVRRDRELQTIYLMQQYAKAINAFQQKNHIYPISPKQLTDARQPRFLRCPKDGCIDPLTGENDWLVIPQSQAPAPRAGGAQPGVFQNAQPQNPQPQGTPPPTATTGTSPAPTGVPMKDYAGGPFVGIKPNKTGSSLILLNGADHYEQWSYTAFDYQNDRNLRLGAAQKVWQ